MWLMLQRDKPGDYVVATGVGATVRDFAERAFSIAGLDYQKYVQVNEKFIRPTEVNALIGDASIAEASLGWKARTHWDELADIMVQADIKAMSTTSFN